MPEILESDSNVGKVWRPMVVEGDEASWAIVHAGLSGRGAGGDPDRDGISLVLI